METCDVIAIGTLAGAGEIDEQKTTARICEDETQKIAEQKRKS